MITYQKQIDMMNNFVSLSKKKDGVQIMSIPLAPDNTDYQKYLEWLEEGNTPEEAE